MLEFYLLPQIESTRAVLPWWSPTCLCRDCSWRYRWTVGDL